MGKGGVVLVMLCVAASHTVLLTTVLLLPYGGYCRTNIILVYRGYRRTNVVLPYQDSQAYARKGAEGLRLNGPSNCAAVVPGRQDLRCH